MSGSVDLAGRQAQVTGKAWLDHEWSSELLPPNAQGWDWVGLNFHDGTSLMAFRMRGLDGVPIWSAATLKPAGAPATDLRREVFTLEPGRRWRSRKSGVDYPVEWKLRVGQRQLRIVPLIDDQELDGRASTGTIYWEGAVRVLENGGEAGRGYLEMTGYGARMRWNEKNGSDLQGS